MCETAIGLAEFQAANLPAEPGGATWSEPGPHMMKENDEILGLVEADADLGN